MPNTKTYTQLSTLGKDILKTLLYYDIFKYPLKKQEIHQCSRVQGVSAEEVDKEIAQLLNADYLFQYEDFLLTKDEPSWINRRKKGNQLADVFLKRAYRIAKFIAAFPFVKGVFVSGSLSKHFMGEDADIDYFIVTEEGRLWTARTLLVLFKKVFLFNSHKYFCVNYFVDTRHLEIEEKNLFTATETVYLLPVYGKEYYDQFHMANPWAYKIFPNFPKRDTQPVPSHKRNIFTSVIESLLRGQWADRIDEWCMRRTVRHWAKKFPDFSERDFDLALKSRKYVSKHHPNNFQKRVLNAHKSRIEAFEDQHSIQLS